MEYIFVWAPSKSVVYEDAKDGYDYNKGRFRLRTFNLNGKENDLTILQHQEGTFENNYSKFIIDLKGLPFKVKKIEIDNIEIDFDKIAFNTNCQIIVDKEFTELHFIGA